MMKKKLVTMGVLLCLLLSGSCERWAYPALGDDAIAFEMGTFEDTEHDGALYGTIEYNGRTYIGYGTINRRYTPKVLDACVGFIVQDEHSSALVDRSNRDRRVYTLAGDENHDFLLDYDSTIKLMNTPGFWRALDTRGKEIELPGYIDALDYDYWK